MYDEPIFPGLLTLPSNRFAFAACTAVAHAPGSTYNPLWIYGPTGTGKTTLLRAMMMQMRERNPSVRIRYIQSEEFLLRMVNAISDGYDLEFRDELAQLDVLMVDHVKILEDMPTTQEVVARLLAQLVERGCQVILASSRTPQQMFTLAQSLEHQCEFALRVNIHLPTPQERLAITHAFARELDVPLTDSLAPRIAFSAHSPSRIRCLLTHLSARRLLLGQEGGALREALDQLLEKEMPV